MFPSKLHIVVILFFSVGLYGQVGSNAQSRSATTTGMRNPGYGASQRQSSAAKIFQKASPLLRIAPLQLANEYQVDGTVCTIAPVSYIALRLAEADYGFDRRVALKQMCQTKTNSFQQILNESTRSRIATSASAIPQTKTEADYLSEVEKVLHK